MVLGEGGIYCLEERMGPAYTMRTIKYGPSDSQAGDLYVPSAARSPVVCLLHGGFWRTPYDREEFGPVARDLASRGFAVWNLSLPATLLAAIWRYGAPLGTRSRAPSAAQPACFLLRQLGWRLLSTLRARIP
jgi:hypothetical protein